MAKKQQAVKPSPELLAFWAERGASHISSLSELCIKMILWFNWRISTQ